MSSWKHRAAAGLGSCLVAIGLVAPTPAAAESRVLVDPKDRTVAAKYDIREVQMTSTGTRLVVGVRVRSMSSTDVELVVMFKDGRGAPHRVAIRRTGAGPRHDVRVQVNAGGAWTSYPCPGLRQHWSASTDRIRLSVPHRCGGAAYDRFRVATTPWGSTVVRDEARSRAALLPG